MRGWYLWRGRLDGHRLGRPAGRGGLGLHLLLDSVVVGDPPIHLGLRLQEQQGQSSVLGGPASPSRHPWGAGQLPPARAESSRGPFCVPPPLTKVPLLQQGQDRWDSLTLQPMECLNFPSQQQLFSLDTASLHSQPCSLGGTALKAGRGPARISRSSWELRECAALLPSTVCQPCSCHCTTIWSALVSSAFSRICSHLPPHGFDLSASSSSSRGSDLV